MSEYVALKVSKNGLFPVAPKSNMLLCGASAFGKKAMFKNS